MIINWSNPCGTIDNASSQVTSVGLSVVLMPFDIIVLSMFCVHVFSSLYFLLWAIHTFSDYLTPITRNQTSEIIDIPTQHHASTAPKLLRCCWFLHPCCLLDKPLSSLTCLAHRKILYSVSDERFMPSLVSIWINLHPVFPSLPFRSFTKMASLS